MKRIVSLVAVAALTIGLSMPVFAAESTRTDKILAQNAYPSQITISGKSVNGSAGDYDLGTLTPQDENIIEIRLTEDMFEWDGGGVGNADTLSASQISVGKVEVKYSAGTAKQILQSVSLDAKAGVVRVKFAREHVSTKALDFDFSVYLNVAGKKQSSYTANFTGTFENDTVEVYGDEPYLSLEGRVAQAMSGVSKIELDVGSGVSLYARLQNGKRYYAAAGINPDAKDERVFGDYSSVETAYTLNLIGFDSASDYVKLDVGGGYEVYGDGMKYLGKSDGELPVSGKYYLSTKKLDVTGDTDTDDEPITADPDEPTDEPDEPDAPLGVGGSGGGGTNPNTGDRNFVPIALGGGAAALIIAVVALGKSGKKK